MFEERIPITILGQTYEILGNTSDALYYNSLAQYVESKMKEIQGATKIVSSQKIAILAALNIADELYRERDSKTSTVKVSDKRLDHLLHILTQSVDGSNVPMMNTEEPAQSKPTQNAAPKKLRAKQEDLLFDLNSEV